MEGGDDAFNCVRVVAAKRYKLHILKSENDTDLEPFIFSVPSVQGNHLQVESAAQNDGSNDILEGGDDVMMAAKQ